MKKAGCEEIVTDVASGKQTHRSGLDRAMEKLSKGDRLVVWRLDRLGRSLKHLIEVMTELEQHGVGFQSLQEAIDTTSPSGKLVFHIFGALAVDLYRQRKHRVNEICHKVGISKPTLYAYVREQEVTPVQKRGRREE